MLIGWVEPNDAELRLWDLHLFPGREYPPAISPERLAVQAQGGGGDVDRDPKGLLLGRREGG